MQCPDCIMSSIFSPEKYSNLPKIPVAGGDLLSAFIALIFSRVTIGGTNTSSVTTQLVLWKHDRKNTKLQFVRSHKYPF